MMKVLVLGANGLLGQAIVFTATKEGLTCYSPAKDELDALDTAALKEYIAEHMPDIIFNCIAYTQVDKAEEEKDAAMRLNRDLPRELGFIVKDKNCFLVHFSTDFVFNGLKQQSYLPEDTTDPLGVYGESKLAGEKSLLALKLPNCAIVRTAWLFGLGKKNFVRSIFAKCQKDRFANVVHDQVGSPTYTRDLASYSLALARTKKAGVYHIVNAGEASWCEFAHEAMRMALCECQINPITSEDYPTPAKRPSFSVLNTESFTKATGITPRNWMLALHDYVLEEPEVFKDTKD